MDLDCVISFVIHVVHECITFQAILSAVVSTLQGYPNTPKSSERGLSGKAKIRVSLYFVFSSLLSPKINGEGFRWHALWNERQSYRIKTPPSDVGARWNKTAIELDSKSDSSDLSDIMVSVFYPWVTSQKCRPLKSELVLRKIPKKATVIFPHRILQVHVHLIPPFHTASWTSRRRYYVAMLDDDDGLKKRKICRQKREFTFVFTIFFQSKTPIGQKSPRNSLKLTAMKRMRDAGWAAVISQDKKKKRVNDKIFAWIDLLNSHSLQYQLCSTSIGVHVQDAC